MIPGERFAYDIVLVDGDSFNQPVLAPIDGVIEHVRDDMADGVMITWGRDAHGFEWRYGNFVSIRIGSNRVLLCHLKRGSLKVSAGDLVFTGQPLADCGNSGRSFAPHLHVHAQNRAAHGRGDGVRIAFLRGTVATVPVPGDVYGIEEIERSVRSELTAT